MHTALFKHTKLTTRYDAPAKAGNNRPSMSSCACRSVARSVASCARCLSASAARAFSERAARRSCCSASRANSSACWLLACWTVWGRTGTRAYPASFGRRHCQGRCCPCLLGRRRHRDRHRGRCPGLGPGRGPRLGRGPPGRGPPGRGPPGLGRRRHAQASCPRPRARTRCGPRRLHAH